MSTQRKNDLLRQGSILAVAGILVRLIGILYRIPMSNLLGDVGNGIYSVAYGIYGVTLTLASSSLPLAVSKLIAQRSIQKQHQNAYRLFRIALIFALIVGAAAALFLFFGADFLEKLYAREGLAKPLHIIAPTVLVMSGLGILRGFFQGKNTMIPTAVSQLLEQIVNAVVSIAAISWMMKTYAQSQQQAAYGAAGGVMGTLAGALTALVFLIFIFFLCRPHLHRQLQSDPYGVTESPQDIMKALMVTVIPVILSQTVYQIGFTLDDLMFGNLMAAKGVDNTTISSLQGVFNSQYNILINAPVAVATAMASSTIPSIAASTVSGNQKEIHRKVRGVVKFRCGFGCVGPSNFNAAVSFSDNLSGSCRQPAGLRLLRSGVLRPFHHHQRCAAKRKPDANAGDSWCPFHGAACNASVPAASFHRPWHLWADHR